MLYINGEKKDVNEVIKEFNVPLPETKIGVLELHPSQVRPDRTNGGIKHTVEKGILAKFRGAHPKDHTDIEIAYSSSPAKKLQDGTLQCNPRIIGFPGHKMRIDITQEKEKWVYLWLHKRCADSPFNKNGERFYQVFNPEIIAKSQMAKDDVLTDCLIAIRETSFDQLLFKAKGMNIPTYEKKEAEVRAEMNSLAKANPEKFIKEFTSETIAWKGTIKDAIDNHIFVQRNHMGMQRWYWGDQGARKNLEICIIDKGADAFEVLAVKISEELPFFRAELKRIADGITAETVVKEELQKPVDVTVTQTKLGEAIEKLHRAGMFHVKHKEVYWKTPDGELIARLTTDDMLHELEVKANNDKSLRMKFISSARPLK